MSLPHCLACQQTWSGVPTCSCLLCTKTVKKIATYFFRRAFNVFCNAELQGVPNVILTPHIGGSTEEAQAAIGREVANALVKYVNTGSTAGAVNFPQVICSTRDARAVHTSAFALAIRHSACEVILLLGQRDIRCPNKLCQHSCLGLLEWRVGWARSCSDFLLHCKTSLMYVMQG